MSVPSAVRSRPNLPLLGATAAVLCCLASPARAALEVASTSPSPYALGVPKDLVALTVEFTKPILTPGSGEVRVFGAMSGLHDTALEVDGGTLTVTVASGPFQPGEMVHVNLHRDVEATDSETLDGGFTFAFTVASGPTSFDLDAKMRYGASDIPYFIYGGDVDGDGTPDLAVPNEGTDDVSVFRNTGGLGFFTQHDDYDVGDKPSSVFGEDFDNDGDIDLASADINSGTVTVLKNNGDGTYAHSQTLACGSQCRQVHGGDFDGDNDVDLCATSYTGGYICLYENDGAGVFGAAVPFLDVPDGPFTVRTGDIDRDGHLDIAVAGHDSHMLGVLINDGTGGFASTGSYFIGNGPWDMSGNDLTGDGYIDFGVVASWANQFVAMHNDGTGAFPTKDVSVTGSFPLAAHVADLDGDGDIDGIASNYSGASVSVLRNTGAGVFDLETTLSVRLSGSYSWAHDLDGDGDLDLSVVDENADSLFIFYNDGLSSSVEIPPPALLRPSVRAWPNPLPAGQSATVRMADLQGPIRVEVLGVDGRRIREIARRDLSGAEWSVTWDGRDGRGRPVASGRYLIRAVAGNRSHPVSVQVLR